MSLDEAEVDWALLGDSLHAQNQYEIFADKYSEILCGRAFGVG